MVYDIICKNFSSQSHTIKLVLKSTLVNVLHFVTFVILTHYVGKLL